MRVVCGVVVDCMRFVGVCDELCCVFVRQITVCDGLFGFASEWCTTFPRSCCLLELECNAAHLLVV